MYTEGFEVKTNEELPLNNTKRNTLFLSSIDGKQLKEPIEIIHFDGSPEEAMKESEYDFCYSINQAINGSREQGQIVPKDLIESIRNIRESCMMDCDKKYSIIFYVSRLNDGTYTSYSGKMAVNEDEFNYSFHEIRSDMLPVLNNFVEEE